MASIETDAVVNRLSKDLKLASMNLSESEARYLVDAYYTIQEYRKSTANQIRAMSEQGEPSDVLTWLLDNTRLLEAQIQRALDAYTDNKLLGAWAKSICGIGPVIAAGLMAHIDITKAPTVGAIWRFAGLDPSSEWKKGEKRPWNARLKVLCWKIGQSFVKVSNNPKDIYGHLYRKRKEYEIRRNDAGEYADQAKQKLERFRIGKNTEAYKYYSNGMLPPAHIDQRAQRWAVKLFLAHYHHVAYEIEFGEAPPNPYPFAMLGHDGRQYIPPPNWPMG